MKGCVSILFALRPEKQTKSIGLLDRATETFQNFIETLEVSKEVKAELKVITPYNYTGVY